MTEETSSNDASEGSNGRTEEKFQGAGELLAEAREKKGLTLDQVSERLKLSVNYLKDLEACHYEHLPGRAFVKGYLRSYARLVDLDEERVIALFGETVQADQQVAQLLREPLPERHTPSGRWLTIFSIVLVLGIVGGSTYWWMSGSTPEADSVQTVQGATLPSGAEKSSVVAPAGTDSAVEQSAGQEEANASLETGAPIYSEPVEQAEEVVEPAAPVVESSIVEVVEQPAIVEPAPEETVAVVEPPAAASVTEEVPQQPSAGNQLVIRFSEDCWVEIKNAEGRVLVADLKRAGTELSLEEEGPVSIKFGNVAAVESVLFNGQAVGENIPASSRGVGRLNLG
ncbi:RodZ domain-containing protein [Parendozoicomonas haliclonae]|uniref:Cytoskeleton protein RodZ n=1 Tax=Parendozoicomonas haliclonae TaxID=1960125 RepID=A0A1X7AGR8_9GAMM|nr:RodZ domain-containing protein [Parendozoicomonas haliclonae]SMA33684.1 Cytoskeleton protein RodZ [Parendozoicomonas haliclonae]